MLKEMWVVAALFNVDGFEFKKELWDYKYNNTGDCVQAVLDLQRTKSHQQYECFRSYPSTAGDPGTIYPSQPSWMSNDAAREMVEKQQAQREALKHRNSNQ